MFSGLAVFVAAVVFSTATYAVLTFYTNKALSGSNADFISGYAAGAADLLAALDDADYISPAHRDAVQRAVRCSTKNNVDFLVNTWRDYYKQGRGKDDDNAGASFYLALRDKC